MAIATQRYIRKPLYVDAVRVTAANFEEIAAWCQGDIQQEDIPGKGTSKKFIRVRVQNPMNPRQTKAFAGDWILYTETGYKVYTVKAFHAAFDEVKTTPEPGPDRQSQYPREEGETIVLGPEVFISKDASVINWKGHNYVPQVVDPIQAVADKVQAETATVVNRGEEREIGTTLPKYPDPVFEPATAEGIADAVRQNEIALASEETRDEAAEFMQAEEEPGKVEPSATEGRRVLSEEEQAELSPEELRDLLQEGDVVLAQDIAHP